MTKITAELQLASYNTSTKNILYTFVLTYPRIILPEVNTHRDFSRNTSSSRAIPSAKIRAAVMDDPFIPVYVGRNQKGMQAGAPFAGEELNRARNIYGMARYPAVAAHYVLDKLGVHKQITNRLLEPWMWTRQIVSTTQVDNFFAQRCDEDAEPHMQELARQMLDICASVRLFLDNPDYSHHKGAFDKTCNRVVIRRLEPGEWHLPFADEYDDTAVEAAKVVSAARCARVSYNLYEGGVSTFEKDMDLYDKLAGSEPKHLSPFEHAAQALHIPERSGNFIGFRQLRKDIEMESTPVPFLDNYYRSLTEYESKST